MRPKRFLPWLLLLVLIHTVVTVHAEPPSQGAQSASDDDFVSVDLSKEPTISGKAHAIAAFAMVIGILIIYSYSLLHREKKVRKELEQIKKKL